MMGLFGKFLAKVKGASTASKADWDELEADLLSSDLGPAISSELIEQAKKIKGGDAIASLREILASQLSSKSREIARGELLTTILVVGVNGTGKTTSVAKLASLLKESGSSVVLGAADTFRAAAIDQLQTWGQRIGVEVITGKERSEPASVAFDSAKRALQLKADYLMIDTAGRLQNKSDLMAEHEKVKRVVTKVTPLNEVLLVIDATTGQNGLAQAKVFSESVSITGIIVTKLDGSARGGIALAIEKTLDIPIKFIGTGESERDFSPFDPAAYINGLLA